MARFPCFSAIYFAICFLASLSLLLGLVDANSDLNLTPINRDLYHSSESLMEEIKALVHRHQDKLTFETVKVGNKGYNAEVSVVTFRQGSKLSDDRSKFRILISFGQHGRELITTELALRLLKVLSDEHFIPGVDNTILDKLIIKVVPMENLNGRKLVEAGDLCDRRNGRGVDLNRNWSVDWGKKEEDYDPYEENPGTAPFSEPESQIMRKLAVSFDPHIWANVHSGMEALFMPYDHKNTTPDGLPSQQMKLLLQKVNELHCGERCMVGSGGGSVGYLAHGTATDYMYDILKVPMAFTFEIYGDTEASNKDCFKMFNPTDTSTFNRVLDDWSAAFFTIFKLAPEQLDKIPSKEVSSLKLEKWVSIDEYMEGYLMERSSRYGKKKEGFEIGIQEIRTYFRLFLLSSVLLLFMFCSRISKSKYTRPIVSAVPL